MRSVSVAFVLLLLVAGLGAGQTPVTPVPVEAELFVNPYLGTPYFDAGAPILPLSASFVDANHDGALGRREAVYMSADYVVSEDDVRIRVLDYASFLFAKPDPDAPDFGDSLADTQLPFAYADADQSGPFSFTGGDRAYIDADGDHVVSTGDIRATGIPLRHAGTTVNPHDVDVGTDLYDFPLEAVVGIVRHPDPSRNVPDGLYIDADGSGDVSLYDPNLSQDGWGPTVVDVNFGWLYAQVAIADRSTTDSPDNWRCTGTQIGPSWVLTAAGCIGDVAGTTVRGVGINGIPLPRVSADQVIEDEASGLAMLHLASPRRLMGVPSLWTDDSYPWGSGVFGGWKPNGLHIVSQQDQVTFMDPGACDAAFPEGIGPGVAPICAVTNVETACGADRGGPVWTLVEGQLTLVGVILPQRGCAIDPQVVALPVGPARDWILAAAASSLAPVRFTGPAWARHAQLDLEGPDGPVACRITLRYVDSECTAGRMGEGRSSYLLPVGRYTGTVSLLGPQLRGLALGVDPDDILKADPSAFVTRPIATIPVAFTVEGRSTAVRLEARMDPAAAPLFQVVPPRPYAVHQIERVEDGIVTGTCFVFDDIVCDDGTLTSANLNLAILAPLFPGSSLELRVTGLGQQDGSVVLASQPWSWTGTSHGAVTVLRPALVPRDGDALLRLRMPDTTAEWSVQVDPIPSGAALAVCNDAGDLPDCEGPAIGLYGDVIQLAATSGRAVVHGSSEGHSVHVATRLSPGATTTVRLRFP